MKIMKLFLVCLVCVSLLLMSCATSDLPPEPPAPGKTGGQSDLAGQAYDETLEEYADPVSKLIISKDYIEYGDELVVKGVDEDYWWRFGHFTNDEAIENMGGNLVWQDVEYLGDVPIQNWFKGSIGVSIPITTENFPLGINYLVAYACSRVEGEWDCHGDQWMAHYFKVLPKELPLEPIDQAEEDEPTLQQLECSTDEHCAEGQLCVNFNCKWPEPEPEPVFICEQSIDCPDNLVCKNSMCVEMINCEFDHECPENNACFGGECLELPPEPKDPSQEGEEEVEGCLSVENLVTEMVLVDGECLKIVQVCSNPSWAEVYEADMSYCMPVDEDEGGCKHEQKECDDDDECTADSCNTLDGECVNTLLKNCNAACESPNYMDKPKHDACGYDDYCDPNELICKPISGIAYSSTEISPVLFDNEIYESIIHVDDIDIIKNLNIKVKMFHTYSEDLVIKLQKDETEVILHDKTGGAKDYNYGIYDLAEMPGSGSLNIFDGQSVAGDWELTVEDVKKADQAYFYGWTLYVEK